MLKKKKHQLNTSRDIPMCNCNIGKVLSDKFQCLWLSFATKLMKQFHITLYVVCSNKHQYVFFNLNLTE